MTAVPKPIHIEQGATFTMGFNWYHETNPPTVPPTADLANPYLFPSGTLARMQIRAFQATPKLLEATTGNGKIILGVADGRIELTYSATDTDLLDSIEAAVYDFEIEFLSGHVDRILEGPVYIDPNVTRDVP